MHLRKIFLLSLYIILFFLIGIKLFANHSIVYMWIDNLNNGVRNLRESYMPYFNHGYDDFIQFFPALLLLGLKLGGFKGKLDWKKLIIFLFIATVFTQVIVLILKLACAEIRPDESDLLSFPSGHTATAFMTATMLALEYDCRSRWYSVVGYACAILVGMMRIMNNRHWLFDVIAGAALGIVITDFAYRFTLRILNNKKNI